MSTPPKVEIKRYRRFPGWDYSRGASLFITISTLPRRPLFGRIMAGKVELSPLGLIMRESLEQMPRLNPGILLFGHVVMPDHVHFNVHVDAGLQEPLKVLGKAVSRFKVYTTKQAKLMGLVGPSPIVGTAPCVASGASGDGRVAPGLLWQQGYHDRLCLTREFIDSTERYIAYNPLKWELMHGAVGGLWIQEPLNAPCLDQGDYWKGVGNAELLKGRIVSLRVSREVRTSDQIGAVVARMKKAVERGYVILSGYVSPGEKTVRDMLCALPEARFIRILPSCLPNARFKPESRYVGAFSEGRYLEIAKGNDEVEFGRAACLDYNAEIVEIANASDGGLALYWRADGVHRLGIAQPSSLARGASSGTAQPSSLARGPLSGVANLSCDVQTVSERKGVVLP
ncbi:MAG: hypothetical protein Q4G65_05210 [bacterium]|nr:hypothetical protein [bacterium]